MPVGKIATENDFRRAIKALSRTCSHMRAIHARLGPPSLRDYDGDFAGLVRVVVGQQVSAASAAAIWKRVYAGLTPFAPQTVLAADDAALQALGLSRPKIRTLRALSRAEIDFAGLAALDDDAIRTTLTAVSGIGPWTADIFLLFCLRRADAFPSGDLALQVATQNLLELPARPTAPELEMLAERWRPYRGVAAHLLWAHYATLKSSAESGA